MADLSSEFIRAVASEAIADHVTVTRYLAGVPVRPLARQRIERALVVLGRGDLVRAPEEAK